jgi:hypothetical protein
MRNYKKERANYHSRPEQMLRNAARKRARRQMEKEGKAKAGDGKDVHHKDNDPLNNDKNNLSLVTQHYNRREPRLRKEDAISRAKELAALKKKHAAEKEAEKIAVQKASETTEDMGTVTGPAIAGTGDDSDTVIVKKKKKVYKREALKNSIKAIARTRGK